MDRNEWRKSSYSTYNGSCVEARTAWRTSSHSIGNGQCVQAGSGWRKASRSATRDCAEVAVARRVVLVRDSKDPAGPVLRVSPAGWTRFTAAIKHADGPAAAVAGLS